MADEYPDDKKRSICGHRIQCINDLVKVFQKNDNIIWEQTVKTSHGKKQRISILDQEHKYYVVLQKNSDSSILLWTAYPIDSFKIRELKRQSKKYRNGAKYTVYVQ